jgi:uncharacterized repeat protein (TIGR01451 family)
MTPCYGTIQDAVDAADDPTDVIKVAAGIYTDIHQRHTITQVVYISKTLTIRGGYTITDWTVSDPEVNPTVLDALGQGRVGYISGSISPTVENLNLVNGDATGLGGNSGGDDAGGGLYIIQAEVAIENCRISNNNAFVGGGIYLDGQAGLTGTVMISNTAAGGGGIHVHEGNLMLASSQVLSNHASDVGGGMRILWGDATLIDTQISNNSAEGYYGEGGGIFVDAGEVILIDVQIDENFADENGGGIHILMGSAILSDTQVVGNSTSGTAGGIFVWTGNAILTRTTISNNTAMAGGGLFVSDGNLTIVNSQVLDNYASSDGGGVLVFEGNATLTGTQIEDNSAENDGGGAYVYLNNAVLEVIDGDIGRNSAHNGGGVYIEAGSATLERTQIISNSALEFGGGIFILSGDSTLVNTIVADNQSTLAGPGAYIGSGSGVFYHTTVVHNTGGNGVGIEVGGTAHLTNTIVASHTIGVLSVNTTVLESTLWYGNEADLQGEASSRTNDVFGNPVFIDPNAGDYHVGSSSVAIDQGVPTDLSTDIDGEIRPRGLYPDIGADEAHTSPYIRYVATTGQDTMTCTDPISPCRTIQYAVDVAEEGDAILVAHGTYTGVNSYGGLSQVVYLTKSLTLRGGYTTTNWTVSNPVSYPSTLDAEGQGRVMYIAGNITPTIEGFHITGGDATGLDSWPEGGDAGSGIYIVTATVTISNNWIFGNNHGHGAGLCLIWSNALIDSNVISNNVTGGLGGGLHTYYGDTTIRGNIILANSADSGGGGLRVQGGTSRIEDNTFSGNITNGDGGGMYVWGAVVTLTGNEVISNSAENGGGMFLLFSAHLLTNNIVANNIANSEGGGALLLANDSTLVNNFIVTNRASTHGSGVYVAASSPHLLHNTIADNMGGDSGVYVSPEWGINSHAAFTNTILASHAVGIYVSTGSTATLEGTLWHDNGVDTSGAGTIVTGTVNVWGNPNFYRSSYHIRVNSAAIDRGVDAGVFTDIDGQDRPMSLGPDIGADEIWRELSLDGVRPFAVPLEVVETVQPGDCFTFSFKNCDPDAPIGDPNACYIWDDAGYQIGQHRNWLNFKHVWNQGEADLGFPRATGENAWGADLQPWMYDGWDGPLYTDCFWSEGCSWGDYIHASPGINSSPIGVVPIAIPFYIPVFDVTPQHVEIPEPKPGPIYQDSEYYYHVVGFARVAAMWEGTSQGSGTIRVCLDGLGAPDLSITKTVIPSTALAGQPVTYTLAFSNAGADLATGVLITDHLPVSITVQSVISHGVAITDTGVQPGFVWQVVDLAPGAGGRITITGIVSPGLVADTRLTNTATIDSATGDINPSNNEGWAGLMVTLPRLAFSSAVYTASEDSVRAVITATLAPTSPLPIDVDYTVYDGAVTDTLDFPPGTSVVTFTVPLSDDLIYEADEIIDLVLSDPTNGILGMLSTATLTIVDDDAPPRLAFSGAAYSVGEQDGVATITVTLTGPTALTATVAYTITDGTATIGADYVPVSGTLVFSPGVTLRTLAVEILRDALRELDETVLLALEGPSHATLGVPATAVLTIEDGTPVIYLPVVLQSEVSAKR